MSEYSYAPRHRTREPEYVTETTYIERGGRGGGEDRTAPEDLPVQRLDLGFQPVQPALQVDVGLGRRRAAPQHRSGEQRHAGERGIPAGQPFTPRT